MVEFEDITLPIFCPKCHNAFLLLTAYGGCCKTCKRKRNVKEYLDITIDCGNHDCDFRWEKAEQDE